VRVRCLGGADARMSVWELDRTTVDGRSLPVGHRLHATRYCPSVSFFDRPNLSEKPPFTFPTTHCRAQRSLRAPSPNTWLYPDERSCQQKTDESDSPFTDDVPQNVEARSRCRPACCVVSKQNEVSQRCTQVSCQQRVSLQFSVPPGC
jgi:hypothetical protein